VARRYHRSVPETLPVRPTRPDEAASAGVRVNVFELAGGQPFFDALVDRFYQGVESDPALLAIYPDHGDLAGARHRLALFLGQYWGGPTTYSEERGHPRLFMRHKDFPIDPAARDRWLHHMRAAVAFMDPPEAVAARLLAYFGTTAEAMRNRD
jgi:hemoglobin